MDKLTITAYIPSGTAAEVVKQMENSGIFVSFFSSQRQNSYHCLFCKEEIPTDSKWCPVCKAGPEGITDEIQIYSI